uniref:Uncharacterized protein n=1 Tax=Panagrolaimus sp. PS1159 TaxID=55785 RepID=A0AC35F5S2_9BILA
MSRISSMARFRKNAAITDNNEDRQRSRSTNRLIDTITKRTNFFHRLVTFSAFEHTTSYDESISGYMRRQFGGATTNGRRQLSLRYGTNPHQSNDAELYSLQADMPIKGKEKIYS